MSNPAIPPRPGILKPGRLAARPAPTAPGWETAPVPAEVGRVIYAAMSLLSPLGIRGIGGAFYVPSSKTNSPNDSPLFKVLTSCSLFYPAGFLGGTTLNGSLFLGSYLWNFFSSGACAHDISA